jgi:predicted dehydrogenase
VSASRVPLLEIHCERGSISLDNHLSAAGPVHVYERDDSELGCEGWLQPIRFKPPDTIGDDVVAYGAAHFIDCLRGEAEPLLGAEQALHVLELTEAVRRSIATGKGQDLVTPAPPTAT